MIGKYVNEDLDNDLEAIFVDMMDDGFEVKKEVSLISNYSIRRFDVKITRTTSSGFSFNIIPYKDHIKQLLSIFDRRGIQLENGYFYSDGNICQLNEVDSILKNQITHGTDFRGKTFEEIWDGLLFTIYCTSEKDSITNFTMTFCEK